MRRPTPVRLWFPRETCSPVPDYTIALGARSSPLRLDAYDNVNLPRGSKSGDDVGCDGRGNDRGKTEDWLCGDQGQHGGSS